MKILKAAIRHPDGEVFSLKRPARHADVAAYMRRLGVGSKGERGFVMSDGKFAGRQEAKKRALASGQVERHFKRRGLHSEDLF